LQWYKELFNSMGFDPCNRPLKIWESIGTPIPKMGVHLGVWRFNPSHSFALSGAWDLTPGLPSWPRNLVSPCFGREPKARVATQEATKGLLKVELSFFHRFHVENANFFLFINVVCYQWIQVPKCGVFGTMYFEHPKFID